MKKKVIALLSLSAFVFVGCNAGANAQTEGVAVGNPDSANTLVIQQGYEAVATVPAPASTGSNNVFPDNLNNTNNNNMAPAANQMQPSNANGALIIENVTETTTPDSYEIEMNRQVLPQ